jgi:transcriptional regulator with XRE-family HTH domain
MEIGPKLRELRKARNLTQGDIEQHTGLLRSYTANVENCRITPSLATIEKYARAFEVPLYRIFCDDDLKERPIILKVSLDFEKTEDGRAQTKAFAAAWKKLNRKNRRLLVAIAEILVRS